MTHQASDAASEADSLLVGDKLSLPLSVHAGGVVKGQANPDTPNKR